MLTESKTRHKFKTYEISSLTISSSVTLINKMPTFLPSLSFSWCWRWDRGGRELRRVLGALTVTWGSVPLSHLPLPVNVKLPLSPLIRRSVRWCPSFPWRDACGYPPTPHPPRRLNCDYALPLRGALKSRVSEMKIFLQEIVLRDSVDSVSPSRPKHTHARTHPYTHTHTHQQTTCPNFPIFPFNQLYQFFII